MDYLSGGDLRYNICQKRYFTEEQVKFIVCCIVLVLEHIRSKHIIHRDLKPENLVFDERGFMHLTDFGIAYDNSADDDIIDSSGTPGYMAPEVFLHTPQYYTVDYFALGVITHELMLRKRPYSSIERKAYKEEVLTKEIKLKPKDLPTQRGWKDENVIDFINSLLKRKPKERLGYHNISEIIHHPWLNGVDWEGIFKKTVDPPFSFKNKDNFDSEYANQDETNKETNLSEYVEQSNQKKYFRDYYYNRFDKDSNMPQMAGGRTMRKSQSSRSLYTTNISEVFKTTNTRKGSEEFKKPGRRGTYANIIYRKLLEGNKNENKSADKEPEQIKLNLKENKDNQNNDENKDAENDKEKINGDEITNINIKPIKGASMKRKGGGRRSVMPIRVNHERVIDELQ